MGIISPKANYEENGKELEECLEPNEYESDFPRSGSKHHEPDQKLQQKLEFVATNTTDESRKNHQTFIRLAEIFHFGHIARWITATRRTSASGNWYLASVRAKKRELCLKYLEMAIKQNQLPELFLAGKTFQ